MILTFNSKGFSMESPRSVSSRTALPQFRSHSRRANFYMQPQPHLSQQHMRDISIRLFQKVQSPQPKLSREWKSIRQSPNVERKSSRKISLESRARLFSRFMSSPQRALSPQGWTTRNTSPLDLKGATQTNFNSSKDISPMQTQIRSERNKISLASLLKYRYNRKYVKPMPTEDEKIRFGEFFNEKMKCIKHSNEKGHDNYNDLEKDLEIQEVKYVQATKYKEINPVLKKLLQQQRFKELQEQSEKKYYSKKQREQQIIEQEQKEYAVDQLIVEYRRKAGFEEILGDAIKDRAQIQGFIDKVIAIQNKILKQFKHKHSHIKTNPMKRFNLRKNKRRQNISSEGYEYIALKFFIKVGHNMPISNFTKLKMRMIRVKELSFNLKDVMRENIFTISPFQRKGSRLFFDIIKLEDQAQVKYMLNQCPWHVYDFDITHQTALHIVAKRGHMILVELLLEYHSDPNALDFVGQTPLYYAMKNNHQSVAMFLLAQGASPWSDKKNQYSNLKMYEEDVQIRQQFKKARQIELMVSMSPQQVQKRLKTELMKQLGDL